MDDSLARRGYEAARPRRQSAAPVLGANVSLQDGEVMEVHSAWETQAAPGRLFAAGGRMERRNSLTQGNHQRHMPMEPLKLTIPRKTKEKRALVQHVSTESREYEDMMTILTSSYIDTGSAGCFTYSKPRLIYSELLEKEFVEKRKEMKSEGRTDKELEESYCFLLADTFKLPLLCEKGLFVGQSRITVLGNPSKGVYLSRYSDLLQVDPITPGATGEIIIFKVMKGKVKSIYENIKNLLDPTPRFDSHICKNASKVTSLNSYRAFDLTQQYFYEYAFDELRQRPRQVCPYAVISFHFKGKDSPLPSTPLAPIRLNSQSAEGNKDRSQFTVWTGDLVKADRVLFQISIRSLSSPFLPHRLPEKLEVGWVMRLDQVTKLLPSDLFSYKLYKSSQEVMKDSHYCSLLEVIDRSRSTTSVTKLLQELEIKRVVLVTPLTERGFLFLLSSVQMATPIERGENWKRCLQALFVFPESRDVAKPSSKLASPSCNTSESVMPQLSKFIPALHHALVKARANPPPELSAGVERQAREYFVGLKDGKVRQYPMGDYDPKLNERGKFPHRVNMDGYLRSYLYSPVHYLLSVARAKQMVEAHCGSEEPQDGRLRNSYGDQRDATRNAKDKNTQKMQQLIDLVLTCKRNAENEVKREEAAGATAGGVTTTPGRKRRLEQETAERALKFLKASQEPGKHSRIPAEGSQVPASPGSFASVIGSVGLKDVDLSEDGSELAAKLYSLLTGLNKAARGTASLGEMQEEGQRESCPFDRLAAKLGLPTNCDIDLRKQEELEEQTAGSISSLEGFSPGSHSGEMNHHGAAGREGGGWMGRPEGGYEEEEEEGAIPWVLIPITGLSSERYTYRDRNIPQDPRFQHLTTATSTAKTTKPTRTSPTPSPEPSPPPSPSQCPSPDPSPPPSPSQCPSPVPSPPVSLLRRLSPEPCSPPSPSQCPSPQPSPPTSPSQCPSPQLSHPRSRCQSLEPNGLSLFNKERSGANEEQLTTAASREFAGVSKDREEKRYEKEKKTKEPSIQPSLLLAPERTDLSPAATEREKDVAKEETGEGKGMDAESFEKERELRPFEKVQKRAGEEASEVKQEVEMKCVVDADKEQNGKEELVGGSLLSSSPFCSLGHIDGILDKQLGDFSSEMQLVLQGESIQYSFPGSPPSSSHADATANPHTLPRPVISQFSQYVSFYNPCPPVQDYVSSLQDNIDSMLMELGGTWPRHEPIAGRTNTDGTLAGEVSAFVSSIRAAKAKAGTNDGDREVTAADASPSDGQSPAASRGGEVWQHHASKQFPDAANSRSSPAPPVVMSDSTSASSSVYKPTNAAVHHPPPSMSPQSQWKPQQSHASEATHSIRLARDTSITRTIQCTAAIGSGSSFAGSICEVTSSGLGGVSTPSLEPSRPSEPASTPAPASGPRSGPSPPAAALSSLISQLQPEVFSNLVEIIKDVKRNFVQFYLHSTESGDRIYDEVKEHLLKQGNVEQNPLAFLNQENADSKLLVIIKNKDIAGHVHKIPGLVSLKRHPNVVFVGIDTLDDIRNNSYNELFVSGGCIVSDELVLNPDFITCDQLAQLLMLLEKHSSPECVWRWKVHCKTHKKLKEQSRFRRDAASLLDILSAYQKRQIVEFLPYHNCDMMNRQSPDLDCLMELQARYTHYRHTILLTERQFEFPAYSSGGIIVANIEETLHDFTRLVGYHDIRDNHPIIDDMLAPKEHVHSRSSLEHHHRLFQQSASSLPPLSHLCDQLVPDASCKGGTQPHSGKDFEDLRLAISHLRAERQAQQQRLVHKGNHHTTPLLDQGGLTKSFQHTSGKKAVAATLELIHSALQLELAEEETKEVSADGRKSGGSPRGGVKPGDQRDGTPARVEGSLGGNLGFSDSDASVSSSIQKKAAVTGSTNQAETTSDGAAASSSTSACPVEGDRARNPQLDQEQPVKGEGAASDAKETGSVAMVTDQLDKPSPVVPRLHPIQLPRQQLLLQSPSHLQLPPHSLLLRHHLPQLHSRAFSHGPMLAPLTTPGGGLLATPPVWSGGLRPTGAAGLVWGFQPVGRGFTGSGLVAGYHNPAGQLGNRYRGGQRGGFSGM